MRIDKKSLTVAAISLAVGGAVGFGGGYLVAPTATMEKQAPPSTQATAAPSPNAQVSDADLHQKTQAGAKATVDAFLAQIAADVPAYEKGMKGGMSDADRSNAFDTAFASAYAMVAPSSLSVEQKRSMVASFADLYVYDAKAKIDSQPSSYVLSGDTASIKGTDFALTIGGKVQAQDQSKQSDPSRLTLTFASDQWLVSGFVTGNTVTGTR